MEKIAIQETFVSLKPLCDRLASKPDIEITRVLSDNIKRHSAKEIQYHFEYVLLPIYIHLHNDKLSKEIRHQLVELLRTLLSRGKIIQISYFIKLYIALLIQIYDGTQQNMLIASNEELKESTIKCLNDLIKSSSVDVIESLYVRQNTAKLSQGVYICLSIAKTEKKKSLRLAGIETLMSLAQVHDEADPDDVVFRTQVADVIMFFLPGIAHGLHEIALRYELQHHEITMMAIRAFSRIIALVMEDNSQEGDLTIESILHKENGGNTFDILKNSMKLEGDQGMKKHIETAKRSQEWLDAASIKLNTLIRSLVNLVRHSHIHVRRELLLAVKYLLSKCSRNMRNNFMELVEILITLSEDEVEEIRNLSCGVLHDINEKFMASNGTRTIVEVVEESFYKLLTKLPRLIRRSDDAVQLSYLNQLAGYIKLLGKQRLPHVMTSISHLRRLLLALVYVAELDSSHVSIFEDIQAKDIEDSTYTSLHSWKRFKFIRDTSTEEKFFFVCKLLGRFGDLELLSYSILDLTSEMPQYRKELISILNYILTAPVEDPSILILYKQIIEYYTDSENWDLPMEVSEDFTLGDVQSNIVNCCLLVEGIGNIAMNIGVEYEKYLLKTLYLVIERAGSGNSFISQAGSKALEQIAHSQNHKNVADLLRANLDYISYHVTMKIRRIERNPGVLDVFSIVMKYSTMDVLPYLQGIVEHALAQLSANYYDRNSYSLLKILYIFTICVKPLTNDEVSEEKANKILNKAEIVIQSLLEYYKAKKDSENIEEDIAMSPEEIEKDLMDGTADNFSAYDNEEEKEIKPPTYVKLTEAVMKCCLNFLPSKEIPNSLLSMQILEEGLNILSKWKEQLLPLVHQLWHPLVDRFQHSNMLVIIRAWQLLYTLSHVSQDFIRSRTLKQVLPSLSNFLVKSAKESYQKDSKNAYKYTQMFKLQKILLSQTGTVAKNLKLREKQLWQILDIAQTYLSCNQHPILQECCVQLYKDIGLCNADIVWVKCLAIWNQNIATIPSTKKLTVTDLKTLKTAQSDYQENVETILTWIEERSVNL